jgi:gluconokinase
VAFRRLPYGVNVAVSSVWESIDGSETMSAMIVVVFGVAGSGKSTVGTMLASAMNCAFLEGDALHPPANVDKMSRGIPLTDVDRGPWLAAIRARIVEFARRGDDVVVACSALKQKYRDFLADGATITWIFLKASEELSRFRLENRPSHFMKSDMLASQFDALELPSEDAIVVDASLPPDIILAQVLPQLAHAAGLGPQEDPISPKGAGR